MGGTFNPIHNAHLMMAQAAYEQYKLDEIWFMPSAKPPHKNQDEIAEKEHRKRMVQFAIDKIPYFKISNIEYKRAGKTYTYDTLVELKKEREDAHFYFIMKSKQNKKRKEKFTMKKYEILGGNLPVVV